MWGHIVHRKECFMIADQEKKQLAQEISLLAAGYPNLNFVVEAHEDKDTRGANVVRFVAGPWNEEDEA